MSYIHHTDNVHAAHGYGQHVDDITQCTNHPTLSILIHQFLYEQLNPDSSKSATAINVSICPPFSGKLKVFQSAVAIYFAPSNISGIGGMHCQQICATPQWCPSRAPHYDCIFVEKDSMLPGMHGLLTVQVLLFFLFLITYPCALVQWFQPVGDAPCVDTGLWVIEPELDRHDQHVQSIIHLDCILSAAHLIGVAGTHYIPQDLKYTHSLSAFKAFYVNKYTNHHMHEITF